MGKGIGYGKVILFGEHFVVYSLPAIASAIDKRIIVEAREIGQGKINILDKKDLERSTRMVKVILGCLGLEGRGMELEIRNEIPQAAGMGSSAAFNVAVARALDETFNLELSDEEICKASYEAEKVAHGTPSGIDNTVATYGCLLWFEKNLEGGENKIEKLKLKKPVGIVIGNTGVKGNTKELVASVRERKRKNPKKYEEIFTKAKALVSKAKHELLHNNLEEVGKLMNENQEVLREIGVSSKELEELVAIALKEGALGAKLTGAGGGGCMIALTPGEELQNMVSKAFEEKGYEAIKTKVGLQ